MRIYIYIYICQAILRVRSNGMLCAPIIRVKLHVASACEPVRCTLDNKKTIIA